MTCRGGKPSCSHPRNAPSAVKSNATPEGSCSSVTREELNSISGSAFTPCPTASLRVWQHEQTAMSSSHKREEQLPFLCSLGICMRVWGVFAEPHHAPERIHISVADDGPLASAHSPSVHAHAVTGNAVRPHSPWGWRRPRCMLPACKHTRVSPGADQAILRSHALMHCRCCSMHRTCRVHVGSWHAHADLQLHAVAPLPCMSLTNHKCSMCLCRIG